MAGPLWWAGQDWPRYSTLKVVTSLSSYFQPNFYCIFLHSPILGTALYFSSSEALNSIVMKSEAELFLLICFLNEMFTMIEKIA